MTEHHPLGYGETLRRRREQRGLSLNDVAVRTRVRKAYLQALEEEDLAMLPGSAYAVGFLRIYARYLDLDAAPMVAALTGKSVPDDESADAEGAVAVQRSKSRSGRASIGKAGAGKSWWLLLFVVLVLAGGGALFYLPNQSVAPVPVPPVAPPAEPPVPAVPVPALSPVPLQPPAPEATSTPAVEVVELPVLPPAGAVVRIVAAGTGVVKVTLDGQESRSYELQPEQQLNWKVGSQLQLELSAPALIHCWVDEQEVPLAEQVAVKLVPVSSTKAPR